MTTEPAKSAEAPNPFGAAPLTATVAQTCDALGICHVTVRRLIRAGTLRGVRLGRKQMIVVESVNALLGKAAA